ncbi:MAG TPA: oxidoreductase, partial [Nitrolancea sp.]|nr:oxidoreductase [Nitrolancea sp.]
MTTSRQIATTSVDDATIEAFRADFRGELSRPGDTTYDKTRSVFNGMIDRHPALIARPTGPADVVAAVK